MAFCNSCGATLDAGTKFCNKCGAGVPAASVPVASTPAPVGTQVAQGGGGNAVKIILIVVAVIVGLGLITAGVGAYFVHRAYVRVRENVEERKGKVKVETPMGNIETSTDPEEAAHNIGVDVYPGAVVSKDGSASMTIGGMHTATAVLESDDAPDKVAAFYKSKLPSSAYSSNQGDHYSMMSGDKDNMTTINIASRGDKTVIEISRVTKASGSN